MFMYRNKQVSLVQTTGVELPAQNNRTFCGSSNCKLLEFTINPWPSDVRIGGASNHAGFPSATFFTESAVKNILLQLHTDQMQQFMGVFHACGQTHAFE